MTEPLWTGSEWSFDLLERAWEQIESIGRGELGLNCFPNSIEIISSDQMLELYATHALPVMYPHWSFGKHFSQHQKSYHKGYEGLAYEIVQCTNPCISYLMEENSATMQVLVMAHAGQGHNHVFKNNYLFQQWSDADGIIDFLVRARTFIRQCEERYGSTAVEDLLDSCHALQQHGIDRYPPIKKRTEEEIKVRLSEREAYYQSRVSELWPDGGRPPTRAERERRKNRILPEPTENILKFIELNSPILEPWEREIIKIVRTLRQYFWPHFHTKTLNEGFATTIHYTIMNLLYERGLMTEGSMLEFLRVHTAVVKQRGVEKDREGNIHFHSINPYHLGFHIFQDIRRICTEPTDEDRYYFPHLIGQKWLDIWKTAAADYQDESFILQFLSPHLMRKMRLFVLRDDLNADPNHYMIKDIHDEEGYRRIRKTLAQNLDATAWMPQIRVNDIDLDGDRTLYLRHNRTNLQPLDEKTGKEVVLHTKRLWGFPVILRSYNGPRSPISVQSIWSEEQEKA